MKRLILAAAFAMGLVAAVEAQEQTVSQADLQAIIQRLNKLEAENKAQAARIAELEGKKQVAAAPAAAKSEAKADEGTEISKSGKVYTTESGRKYYLADATAGIFEPLSESGLQLTPYGYLVFEGVYADHGLDLDWTTDFVQPKGSRQYRNHNSTLSMQDSILGVQFATPEAFKGWKFSGKAEFDLAGDTADDYAFHWRHLYVDATHAAYDADGKENGYWSILFGQTWHLWKMVAPSEIDGAWMENAGHPYRRSPQVRVTRKWDWEDSSLEARIGFVKNGPNASTDRDGDDMLDSSASAWGWIEAALVYDHQAAWEEKDHRWLIGLGGMYGRDASRRCNGLDGDGNMVWDGRSDDYNSQMLILAGSIPFSIEKVGEFTLCGQAYVGENLGRVQAGCGQSVSFYNNEFNRRGEEVATVGGFVDLGYKLNDTWSFALGYGFDNPEVEEHTQVASNNGSGLNGDFYQFNDRLYLDAFYNISANFRLGLEYARLSTKYAQTGDAIANRVQFTAFYDF